MADREREVVHHEGWLEKQSPSQVKGWQKRWVVLHQNTLKYWKDQDDYRAEDAPSGCIQAHTVLSITPHAENVLEFSIKVLKSRTDVRKYEWRIWTGSDAAHRKGNKGKNSVSAVAWNARVTWMAFLDDWCEKHLAERLFSRFHVRKPAKFLDEVMGLDQEEEDDAPSEDDVQMVPRRGYLGQRQNSDERRVTNLESYLDKRSPDFFALWQRRWFVYMEAEDMIVYYKSREEYLHGSEPVGSFQIADLNTVQGVGGLEGRELHLETMTAPELKDSHHSATPPPTLATDSSQRTLPTAGTDLLQHEVRIRTYRLRALTTASRDQWVSQLKQRINIRGRAAVMRRISGLMHGSGVVPTRRYVDGGVAAKRRSSIDEEHLSNLHEESASASGKSGDGLDHARASLSASDLSVALAPVPSPQ